MASPEWMEPGALPDPILPPYHYLQDPQNISSAPGNVGKQETAMAVMGLLQTRHPPSVGTVELTHGWNREKSQQVV